jgi:hypothetical protein
MNAPKRPTTRSTGLGDTCTVQLRLTTPQADWLRSTAKRESISIASVVRGMIDAERVEDEDPAVVEAAFQRFMAKMAEEPAVVRGWSDDGDQMMHHPSGRGRRAALIGGTWWLYSAQKLATVQSGCTEAQAIAWCLKGVLP